MPSKPRTSTQSGQRYEGRNKEGRRNKGKVRKVHIRYEERSVIREHGGASKFFKQRESTSRMQGGEGMYQKAKLRK